MNTGETKVPLETMNFLAKIETIEQLVKWLVLENEDAELQSSFLLTYRTIITPDELFAVLEEITKKAVISSNVDDKSAFFNKLNSFLNLWMTLSFENDWKNKPILGRILELTKSTMPPAQHNLFKQLCINDLRRNRMMQHQQKQCHSIGPILFQPQRSSPSATDNQNLVKKLFKNRKSTGEYMAAWFMIEPLIIAEQMTLLEHEAICAITPHDLMARGQPLSAIAARFNEVSNWVATQVLNMPSTKHQAKIIKRFIRIAEILLQMNNFQSMVQILSGLYNSSVARLKRAWANLSTSVTDTLKRIEEVMSPSQNFHNYREIIKEAVAQNKPVIPYVPLILRDLTFTQEGNSTHNADGNINFEMLFFLGKQILSFKQIMSNRYPLSLDVNVQKLLLELKPLSDDDLYKLSLACEPKQSGTSETEGSRRSPGSAGSPRRVLEMLTNFRFSPHQTS
jgi:hypothetical protein